MSRELSVEISPPRTEQGAAKLRSERSVLAKLGPRYVSVTCGAGGSERGGTLALVEALRRESDRDVVPHVTCVGASREDMRELLGACSAAGVRRVLAVRGDLPAGRSVGDFGHASDLVAFMRAETGDRFRIDVAAHPEFHPEAPSGRADLEHFAEKVRAGASSAITQYFYNADAYFRFVESCAKLGVDIPIVPGVMPIADRERLVRFSNANGVEIPRWLRKRLDEFDSEVDLRAFGVDVVVALCRKLLDGGAPGLHFFTMNRAEPTATIWRALGLETGDAP